MFTDLLESIKRDVVSTLSIIRVQAPTDAMVLEEQRRKDSTMENVQFLHAEVSAMQMPVEAEVNPNSSESAEPFVRNQPKVGRNQPCPCGSGKKYKYCHGLLE
jgi:preprotein translocase subunit SecA